MSSAAPIDTGAVPLLGVGGELGNQPSGLINFDAASLGGVGSFITGVATLLLALAAAIDEDAAFASMSALRPPRGASRGELAPPRLTPRELEILQLAALGNAAPQIAGSLFISISTVKTHMENIYRKLAVSDRAAAAAAAVATAMRLGVIV